MQIVSRFARISLRVRVPHVHETQVYGDPVHVGGVAFKMTSGFCAYASTRPQKGDQPFFRIQGSNSQLLGETNF